jgi:hypothetical protein
MRISGTWKFGTKIFPPTVYLKVNSKKEQNRMPKSWKEDGGECQEEEEEAAEEENTIL